MEQCPNDPNDPNAQLLEAVRTRNIVLVVQLLQHPGLDLNDHVILFQTLYHRNEDVFLRLLDRGFSLEQKDCEGANPLHLAVTLRSPVNLVHELIKRGVDIHACDNCNRTPLSKAAVYGNLEAACMLLYYGADANVQCRDSMTPFMWALEKEETEVAKVLLKYTDLSRRNKFQATALSIATKQRNPLTLEILTNVDVEYEQYEELLDVALTYDTLEIFKSMWSLFGDRVVIKPSLVEVFFSDVFGFLNEEWLEGLNLLLNSRGAKDFYEASFIEELNDDYFGQMMLCCLSDRDIEPDIRLDIITFFVSLGLQIDEEDLNFVHTSFLFNDELRFLIFTYNYEQEVVPRLLDAKLRILFTLEIERDIAQWHILRCTKEWDLLGYIAIPQNNKLRILQFVTDPFCVETLERIPEVPSLVEASRNEVMRTIKKIYNITKAYQYLEVVEKCPLPHVIKDILLLKIKIY